MSCTKCKTKQYVLGRIGALETRRHECITICILLSAVSTAVLQRARSMLTTSNSQ